MESGIKHHHLGHILAESRRGRPDALDVGLVMKGRQRGVIVDILNDRLRHQNGTIVFGPALHDAVADGRHLAEIVDDLALALQQRVLDLIEGGGMVGHVYLPGFHIAVLGFVSEFAIDADALAVALGQHHFPVHIDELVFERGAPRVDDQNLHFCNPFIFLLNV